MLTEQVFSETLARLKDVLQPFAEKLIVKEDQPDNYVLISPKADGKNKEIFFAGLQIKKNYVSFHLMPIYDAPELLNEISPELKKRMQGKTCFNFKKAENDLFAELSGLIKQGFELYQQKELI